MNSLNNLYVVFEGFSTTSPTLFDGLAIYPLLIGENKTALPYLTISYKSEEERKALLVKTKSLWYALCFLYFLDCGKISKEMKHTTWYDGDIAPALATGETPPTLGGYLCRLLAAEGGGRLHKAAKSLSWFVMCLQEDNLDQRVIKLQNGFGELYGSYDMVPTNLASYANKIKAYLNAEEPEALPLLTNELSEEDMKELEKKFVQDFLATHGHLFNLK